MRARALLLTVVLALAAMSSTADAQRSDSRVWWEEKRKAYPQCNALTNEHERLTDELERIAEQARYAKEPQRKQFVDKMNATAKQRTAVQDKLFACIRASGSKPNTADSGQKRPPLQGKVEESETPQKPPDRSPARRYELSRSLPRSKEARRRRDTRATHLSTARRPWRYEGSG